MYLQTEQVAVVYYTVTIFCAFYIIPSSVSANQSKDRRIKHLQDADEDNTDIPVHHNIGSTCDRHFKGHLHKCMSPFTKNVNVYITTKPENPMVNQIFIKHVCRQYKKMLHCIHTVLINCKTPENTKTVQERLGKDWVITVNIMCDIQTNTLEQSRRMTTKGDNSHKSSYQRQSEQVDQIDTKQYSVSSVDSQTLQTDNLPQTTQDSVENNDPQMSLSSLVERQFIQADNEKNVLSSVNKDLATTNKASTGLITVIKYSPSDNVVQSIDVNQLPINNRNLKTLLQDKEKPILIQLLYIRSSQKQTQQSVSMTQEMLTNTGVHYCRSYITLILTAVLYLL